MKRRTFKDYFLDKINKMPSWMSTVGKMKRSKAELEGDPVEGDGKEDHQSTEKLSDSSDSPI
tara:strand:+ start:340 stop:525 length:186 start_codon:yes stop_codon:yes gene_type:complete